MNQKIRGSDDKSSRLAVLSSHLITPIPITMAEKEAALAAVPSDSPTMYVFDLHLSIYQIYTKPNFSDLKLCRFDKIINKEIPANVVFENDKVLHCFFILYI